MSRDFVLTNAKMVTRTICAPESLAKVTVDSIGIFGQPDTLMPFHQIARFQICV